MNKKYVAKVSQTIPAPVDRVWDYLINPEKIKEYMFGTEVISDWKKDSPIVWQGIWQGKPYRDKGVILDIEPMKLLRCTHFSPLSGLPDLPENYHTLTYILQVKGTATQITLTQDNNNSPEEQKHSERMYEMMIDALKRLLE